MLLCFQLSGKKKKKMYSHQPTGCFDIRATKRIRKSRPHLSHWSCYSRCPQHFMNRHSQYATYCLHNMHFCAFETFKRLCSLMRASCDNLSQLIYSTNNYSSKSVRRLLLRRLLKHSVNLKLRQLQPL